LQGAGRPHLQRRNDHTLTEGRLSREGRAGPISRDATTTHSQRAEALRRGGQASTLALPGLHRLPLQQRNDHTRLQGRTLMGPDLTLPSPQIAAALLTPIHLCPLIAHSRRSLPHTLHPWQAHSSSSTRPRATHSASSAQPRTRTHACTHACPTSSATAPPFADDPCCSCCQLLLRRLDRCGSRPWHRGTTHRGRAGPGGHLSTHTLMTCRSSMRSVFESTACRATHARTEGLQVCGHVHMHARAHQCAALPVRSTGLSGPGMQQLITQGQTLLLYVGKQGLLQPITDGARAPF